MTAEQLQSARAEAWRQAANPLLTADDASAWLRETGLCLFLPRTAQIAAPAPSFVEATLGEPNATPARAAIEAANEMLLRLLAQEDAVALNLLGATSSQPDFVATPETLPFIYALRGDKEWKRGPRGKSSPLVVEVWKLLDKEGPLTASEVKDQLGRELTEAAALRALTELWNTLRIEPLYREYASIQDPARWQPLGRARGKQLEAGAAMSAATAISALVSLYLQSSIAATEEEIGAFLSPLCSRSKVRDAVRGLSATRQLASAHIGGAELYHVEGSLPEFAAVEVLAPARPADIEVLAMAEEAPVAEEAAREDAAETVGTPAPAPRKKLGGLVRRSFAFRGEGKSEDEGRKPFTGARRPGSTSGGAARPGARTMGSSRPGSTTRRPSTPGGSARKPYGTRSTPDGSRKPYGTRSVPPASFNASKPWEEDRKPRPSSNDAERGPYPPREPSERKSFGSADKPAYQRKSSDSFGPKKPFGGKKTFGAGRGGDAGGERKPFSGGARPYKPGGERPFTPRTGGDRKPTFGGRSDKPFSDRKPAFGSGPRKPFVPRGEQAGGGSSEDQKPAFGRDRTSGDRPFQPRGDRSFTPRGGSSSPRPGAGGKSFGGPKPGFGGARKPFTPRGEGSGAPARKPWVARDNARPASGADRKPPFKPRGDRPFTSGSAGRPSGDRPFSSRGPGKPFTPRDNQGSAPPRRDARSGGSSYGRMDGGRPRPPYKPRTEGAGSPDRPAANRPFPARPPSDRPRPPTGAKGPGGPKSRTSPFTSSGKPRPGVKPTGRPGPRSNRAPGAPGRPNTGPKKSSGPRKKPEAE